MIKKNNSIESIIEENYDNEKKKKKKIKINLRKNLKNIIKMESLH
jgi:hypothetical protein